MDWVLSRVFGVSFTVASLSGVCFACLFAYFETRQLGWFIAAGACGLLASFETVKITSFDRMSESWREGRYGRLIANLVIWLPLMVGSYFASFCAGNDYIFGAAVDSSSAEVAEVIEWRQEISDHEGEIAKIIKNNDGVEPPIEDVARTEVEKVKANNPQDWKTSKECRNPSASTRATCSEYQLKMTTLGAASGVRSHKVKIEALKERLDKVPATVKLKADEEAKNAAGRPKGLDALMMLAGMIETPPGTNMTVAKISAVIAFSAELLSNLLPFALGLGWGQRIGGMTAAEGIPEEELEDALPAPPGAAPAASPAAAPGSSPTPPAPRGGGPSGKQNKPAPRRIPKPTPKAANRALGKPLLTVVPASPNTGKKPPQSVADFVASLPPEPGRDWPTGELRAAYQRWCHEHQIAPVTPTVFGVQVKLLGFVGRKSVGNTVYTDQREAAVETA